MWGRVLFVVGLINFIVRSVRLRTIGLWPACGVGLPGQEIRNASPYRWSWEDQHRFYWQLSWRVPDIKTIDWFTGGRGAFSLTWDPGQNNSRTKWLIYQKAASPPQVECLVL